MINTSNSLVSHKDFSIKASKNFAYKLTRTFANINSEAITKQFLPIKEELIIRTYELLDPLGENINSPCEGLVHKYPDRVLLLVSDVCAVNCRFCTRKRVGSGKDKMKISKESIFKGIDYIAGNKDIKDVLISGGDPLMLENSLLKEILTKLRLISHISIIRIGTRIPFALPSRINSKLLNIFKENGPIYLNLHINHVSEINDENSIVCRNLINNGVILASQSVLLKGVNDSAEELKRLFYSLLSIGIKPYYLHIPDLIEGSSHFRVKIKKALEIFSKLQGSISGMALPKLMVDLPNGKGKVPLQNSYIKDFLNNGVLLSNYLGEEIFFREEE